MSALTDIDVRTKEDATALTDAIFRMDEMELALSQARRLVSIEATSAPFIDRRNRGRELLGTIDRLLEGTIHSQDLRRSS